MYVYYMVGITNLSTVDAFPADVEQSFRDRINQLTDERQEFLRRWRVRLEQNIIYQSTFWKGYVLLHEDQ